MDELLVRADLIVVQDLCPRAGLQHRANLAQPVLPDFAVTHVEEDGAVVLDLRTLNILHVQTARRWTGSWCLGDARGRHKKDDKCTANERYGGFHNEPPTALQ